MRRSRWVRLAPEVYRELKRQQSLMRHFGNDLPLDEVIAEALMQNGGGIESSLYERRYPKDVWIKSCE